MSLERGVFGTGGGGGGGSVDSVTAGDTSIVVGGSASSPTVETDTLDVIATDHPPAGNWSNNSHKITSLANGSGAQDAAAFGQIPTALAPNGSAGGDLSGSYPNPSVAKIAGVVISATPSSGQILIATSSSSASWQSLTPSPSGPGGVEGANTGSTVTIGAPSGFNQWVGILNAATVTVTMPTAVAGALFQACFKQDGTGGRVLAFAANPTFPTFGSAAHAIAALNARSAASQETWVTFICVDGSTWEGFPVLADRRQVVAISSAGTVTPVLFGGADIIFTLTLAVSGTTINAPTGTPVDGQKIEFRLTQSASSPVAPTWNSAYTTANTALITWPSEPTSANATWKELYEWIAGTSKWERLAMV